MSDPLCTHDDGCSMCAHESPVSECLCKTSHCHIVSGPLTDDAPSYEQLAKMIRTLLKSAVPHPTEHPTMTAAWREAEVLLEKVKAPVRA